MSRRRLQRLNEQLKRELAEMIRTGVRDPRVGVVTVTAVSVTPDLSVARVYVRILGDPAEVRTSLEGLAAAAPYLRGALGKELKIRRVPELRFQRDESLEHALRIEGILADVLPHDVEATDGDPAGEETADGASAAVGPDTEDRASRNPDEGPGGAV